MQNTSRHVLEELGSAHWDRLFGRSQNRNPDRLWRGILPGWRGRRTWRRFQWHRPDWLQYHGIRAGRSHHRWSVRRAVVLSEWQPERPGRDAEHVAVRREL